MITRIPLLTVFVSLAALIMGQPPAPREGGAPPEPQPGRNADAPGKPQGERFSPGFSNRNALDGRLPPADPVESEQNLILFSRMSICLRFSCRIDWL